MDRPSPNVQPADGAARSWGSVRSAFAALAALILSITAVAAAPSGRTAECALERVALVGELHGAMRSPAAPAAEPGSVAPRPSPEAGRPRAALALRATVMLRHTALPPPAC